MNIQGSPSSSLSSIHSLQAFYTPQVSEAPEDDLGSTIKPVEQAPESIKLSVRAEEALKHDLEDQQLQNQERIEQEEIKQLAARDREVRQHEQAHAAAGGPYAGAPRYEYQRGPDGVSYAVGGEVSISTSPIKGDPEMTIQKAQVIQRAALAPAEPSTQDRKVAAEAVQMEMEARVELMALTRDEQLQESKDEEQAAKTDDDNELTPNDPLQSRLSRFVAESAYDVHGLSISNTESDPVDVMNQTQEGIFNEINQNLASQLASLGAGQSPSQSIGSIVSQFT